VRLSTCICCVAVDIVRTQVLRSQRLEGYSCLAEKDFLPHYPSFGEYNETWISYHNSVQFLFLPSLDIAESYLAVEF
jgi:hypothetical protein